MTKFKYKTLGIGSYKRDKKIKAERKKPIPLMKVCICEKCTRIYNSDIPHICN